MKKLLVFVLVLLLTGCTTKNLECERTYQTSDINVKQNIIATFKTKLEAIDMTLDIEISEENLEFQDILLEDLKQQYEHYNDIDGIKIVFNKKETSNEVRIIIDINEVNETELNNLFGDSVNINSDYNTTKQDFINNNYTCK